MNQQDMANELGLNSHTRVYRLESPCQNTPLSVNEIFALAKLLKINELDYDYQNPSGLSLPQAFFKLALDQLASQKKYEVPPTDNLQREVILARAWQEGLLLASERDELSETLGHYEHTKKEVTNRPNQRIFSDSISTPNGTISDKLPPDIIME